MKATALVATFASLFLCAPATAQTRIAFLGDSITQGIDDNHASYRWPLWDLLSMYCVDFVGTRLGSNNGIPGDPIGAVPLGNPPPRFDQDHDGVSGQNTFGVAAGVLANLPAADIYVLEAGTNDLAWGYNPGFVPPYPTPDAIFSMLSQIVTHLLTTGSKVIVCTLTPADMTAWPSGANPNFDADRVRLNHLIMQPGAFPGGTVVATPDTWFNPTVGVHTSDGLHPNVTGEQIYAQAVSNALAPFLVAAPAGACFKQYGMGCRYVYSGTPNTPKLWQSGPPPTPGATIRFELGDLPPTALGLIAASLTDRPALPAAPPIAAGCSDLVDRDVVLLATPHATPGEWWLDWTLPTGTAWLGTKIHVMGLTYGGGFDGWTSNAGIVHIGL